MYQFACTFPPQIGISQSTRAFLLTGWLTWLTVPTALWPDFGFARKGLNYSIEPFRGTIEAKNRWHRFLWEQKVAKKVKVCKLFSQLSSCTLFMGAKSCEKSLETFTFDNNRAIWSKSLQTFCVANVAGESCTAEKIPVRGSAKSWTVLEGHTTHTVCSTQSHARAPHDAHDTKYGRTWITR